MTFKVTPPPIRTKFDKETGVNTEWVDWTNQVYTIMNAVSQSGVVRPPAIYVGQMFFDTSLGAQGKPIWIGSDGTWRLADGSAA